MKNIIDNLRKKGWDPEDVKKTERILSEAAKNKPRMIKLMDNLVYWTGLIIAIAGNFAISVILIPFLVLMKTFYVYLSLIFLGILFGWVFSIILKDIESIKGGQHVISWAVILSVGLINIYLITDLSNHIASLMEISSGIHTASVVSLVYITSFMFPYFLEKAVERIGKRNAY